MTVVRSALIVVALAIAGCAETDTAAAPPQGQARQAPAPPAVEVRQHGLTAELPQGWHSAAESLTPHLVDPREELAVATFPLRYRQPFGTFSGTLPNGVELAEGYGVMESHDVTW